MGRTVTIAFYGQPEFTEVLRKMQDDFGAKDQQKILQNAIRIAMKPVLARAKSLVGVDTGALQTSLRIESRKPSKKDKNSLYVNPSDTVIGTVTTAPPRKFAKLKKEFIKNQGEYKDATDKKSYRKTRKDFYKANKIAYDGRSLFNEFGTAKRSAKPYLRPALETSSTEMLSSLADSLRTAITKYQAKPPKKG
jgi:HK97 gp10 family phage protein